MATSRVLTDDAPMRIRVGAAISTCRFKAGLSPSDLARATGLGVEEIKSIESGETDSPDAIKKICACLGVRVSALLDASLKAMPADAARARKKLDDAFAVNQPEFARVPVARKGRILPPKKLVAEEAMSG